jgi:hypothetical protein
MKEITETLLAAQRSASRRPYVTLTATNKTAGVIRPEYAQLYTGSEPDTPHAFAVAGDGSLIRFRITPSEANRCLLRQRVANPGPGSDFSHWVDTGRYDVLAVAACVLGNTVSVFWLEGDRSIHHQKSTDNGATWGTPEPIGSTTSTSASGIAAAYKDNGDIAVFFTDMEVLYLIKRENGGWQAETEWDKTTGFLSGVGAIYDGDWDILITGQDADGNYRAWSLVYGDGANVPAGMWSDLKEVAAADATAGYAYIQPFMTKADVIRGSFVERFTGTAAYRRPYTMNIVPGSEFAEGRWSEPLPFNLSGESGLAEAYHDDCLWLACPAAVFTADLNEVSLDLSAGIASLKEELDEGASRLTVELANPPLADYALPGFEGLSVLEAGCGLEVGLGYVTTDGAETGMTVGFRIDALEHISGGGKAKFILHASGGWEALEVWRAHTQFRWNESGVEEACVKDILAFVLGRAGIPLEVRSASALINGFFPDFTIHPGDNGRKIVRELLSLVPDALVMAGDRAYLLEPAASGETVYAYGVGHDIFEERFVRASSGITHVQVEGYDDATGEAITVDSYDWEAVGWGIERLLYVRDRNIGSVTAAVARGEARLRKSSMQSEGGVLRVPLNSGQELYDIVEIYEPRAGLDSAKRRVLGMEALYDTRKSIYEQKLYLGAV